MIFSVWLPPIWLAEHFIFSPQFLYPCQLALTDAWDLRMKVTASAVMHKVSDILLCSPRNTFLLLVSNSWEKQLQ